MTTKGLRYEKFECDVCHKKEKKEIEASNDGAYFLDGHTYIFTTTWTTIDLSATPTKKSEPEKIEMCEECNLSFKAWRIKRVSNNE